MIPIFVEDEKGGRMPRRGIVVWRTRLKTWPSGTIIVKAGTSSVPAAQGHEGNGS